MASEITPSERQQKWLRKLCLERDGNRCVISGNYDFLQWQKLPDSDPIRDSEVLRGTSRTQAAHIVSFCCGSLDKTGVSALSRI